MNILCATDLLPKCESAIDRAGILADQLGSDLSILHVVPPCYPCLQLPSGVLQIPLHHFFYFRRHFPKSLNEHSPRVSLSDQDIRRGAESPQRR